MGISAARVTASSDQALPQADVFSHQEIAARLLLLSGRPKATADIDCHGNHRLGRRHQRSAVSEISMPPRCYRERKWRARAGKLARANIVCVRHRHAAPIALCQRHARRRRDKNDQAALHHRALRGPARVSREEQTDA